MIDIKTISRFEAQIKYGHYCNYVRSKGSEPLPYRTFLNQLQKGLGIKQITNHFEEL
jgi:hypothetical protein